MKMKMKIKNQYELNDVTLQAMKDAQEGKTEGPIDTSNVEAMLKSMGL